MSNYLTQIILAIFLAVAAYLGAQAKNLYRKYITTEIKQNVVKTAVRFVEQVYKDIHGKEKLEAAMARASDLLAEYGIQISEYELVSMIESAVAEFNDAFWRNEIEVTPVYGEPVEDKE